MRKAVKSFAAASVLGVTLLWTGASEAAAAAQWTSISGTVIEGGAWYRSSNVRLTRAQTDIWVKLTKLPASSNGVDWYLNRASTGTKLGVQVWISNTTDSWRPATGVPINTGFQNNFKQHTAKRGVADYEFRGQEYY